MYISNRKIDFVYPTEDGTIQIFDVSDWGHEYPLPWRYKLYQTFEENEKDFLSILYENIDFSYELSERMQKYLDNRKSLYAEISKKYLPIVKFIIESDFDEFDKKKMLNALDIAIYKLYPYFQN